VLGLPGDADSVEQLVVLKRFFSTESEEAREQLGQELALAARLEHENIVRTLRTGFESGQHFQVTEYLDGTTLRTFLRWVAWSGVILSNAAVARILLAVVDAVSHAHGLTRSEADAELVNQPIATTDVFITYDGAVKLLGFKEPRASSAGPLDEIEPVAIDALLSRHLRPELSLVLIRLSKATRTRSVDRLWQIGQGLHSWQSIELASDGQTEIASIMSGLLPHARLKQTARLHAALARLRAERGASTNDLAPVSGFRIRSAQSPSPAST
jgi:serine/threonine protein kinase